MFYIDSIGIILWQMETYFVNEKQEFSRSTLQVVGCVPRLENILYLFNILQKRWQFYTHARLYYSCVKVWMVKLWQIFGQSSISPNFCGTKVSLYMVASVNTCTCEFNFVLVTSLQQLSSECFATLREQPDNLPCITTIWL